MPNDMLRGSKAGILILFGILTLMFIVPSASATQNRLRVTIDQAYYCALEEDGIENDILIDFTCTIAANSKVSAKSDFYLTMTLPSGLEHLALVTVVGKYTEIRIRVHWYDTAWETGWYNLRIDTYTYGADRSYCTSVYDFDPPKSGTGEPSIQAFML